MVYILVGMFFEKGYVVIFLFKFVDEIHFLHDHLMNTDSMNFTTFFRLFYNIFPMFAVMEFNALTLNNVTNSFLEGTLSKKFRHS